MNPGLFFLPEDAECVYCGKTPCPCSEQDDPEPQVEVICHRTRDDHYYNVYLDGTLTHERCGRDDLERLGYDHVPVSQTYCH